MNKLSTSPFKYLRDFLTRGALFVIPIWLTLFVVGMVYGLTEAWLGGLTSQIVRWIVPSDWLNLLGLPDGTIPGLSLIAGLVLLVGLGAIASRQVGRQGLRLIDYVFLAIPGVNTIYASARKIIEAVGEPGKSRFQKVVLINWPGPSSKVIGFVTNEVIELGSGRKQYWVFVPTVPNPTSGFAILIYADEATLTNYSTEDGFKLIISMGVIAPGSSLNSQQT